MAADMKSDLAVSTKWASLIHHCAYRGKNKLSHTKTCSHLFSLSGKCKLNHCPIVQSKYLTFQLDEGNNLIIMIEKTESERISDNWIETEFNVTDDIEDKIKDTINKYPVIKDIAERKFQMLYTLGKEIAESMSELIKDEDLEDD
ncbi:MAG: hypothetical protein ACXAEU_11305 [Candidatus Hodarchaeales archaeon]